jgi:hypothetical protein
MKTLVMEQLLDGIPGMVGLSKEQMNDMGPMLQYLKCQDMIEYKDNNFECEMCPKHNVGKFVGILDLKDWLSVAICAAVSGRSIARCCTSLMSYNRQSC